MKHLISTTLLLLTIITTSLNAQQISTTNFNQEFIHEDFNQEGEYFKIETTTDNYFILDKGDYLLSRNNAESEYAIIANKSSVNNFTLKTAIRLGPSNNKKGSIGIVLKAQQDGKGAIIFEINKKGEYRIKQLLGDIYKTISGKTKNEGWVKSKTINSVDEHNFIDIRTENNIYDVYVNSNYITTFFIPDYINGTCGLIISPETKARIAYYYIYTKGESNTPTTSYSNENSSNTNTTIEDLNRKVTTLELNNKKLNSLNSESRESQEKELKLLREKNKNQSDRTIELEQEIASLNRSITDLKNSNLKIIELENKITENNTFINNLNSERSVLSTNFSKLNEKNSELASVTIEQEKEINILKNSTQNSDEKIVKLNTENKESLLKINSLNNKNLELASVTIEQEKEINILKNSTQNSDEKIVKLNTENKEYLLKINSLNNKNSKLESIINDLKTKNTSVISDNKKQINKIESLKNQVSSEKSLSTNLTNDFSDEKIAHRKIKDGLSKSITNKIAEIKALENQLKNTSKQLNLANKDAALSEEYAKNIITLTEELKNATKEIIVLEKIKNTHDNIVNELNIQIALLKDKQIKLSTESKDLNKKIISLEEKNIELKELFILKDFELNGVKPSELTKQTNNYTIPKEIKGNSTIYAVQFGVFMQVPSNSKLKALDDVWYETTDQGTYIYFSGGFKDPQEAAAHKNKVAALGYPNAFVVTLSK